MDQANEVSACWMKPMAHSLFRPCPCEALGWVPAEETPKQTKFQVQKHKNMLYERAPCCHLQIIKEFA
jgi:hypothetical protein